MKLHEKKKSKGIFFMKILRKCQISIPSINWMIYLFMSEQFFNHWKQIVWLIKQSPFPDEICSVVVT